MMEVKHAPMTHFQIVEDTGGNFACPGTVIEGTTPLRALIDNFPGYRYYPAAIIDIDVEGYITLFILDGPSFGHKRRYGFRKND